MVVRYAALLIVACTAHLALAQGAGDDLFDTDQVITMRFTFDDPGFWPDLVTNYHAGQEASLPATLTITDLTGTYTFDSVAVRLKGNSSFDHHPGDKKPMKVDFNEHVAGQAFHGLKKLNLSNNWSDPTFLREKVLMDACRREGVLAPRVSFANVYLNDQHWGFYSVIEQVDKTFVERWLDDNDGNLFKSGDNYTPDGGGLGLEADLKYYGATATSYTGRYELKTNETQDDWTDLIELLDVIDHASASELLAELPQRFAWDALLRSLALDNLFGNMDAYYGSARNYYLYHDSTTLKWNWVHWDANMAFGRYRPQWVDDVTTLPSIYFTPGRRLLQRIIGTTALRQAYLMQYCELFQRFSNAELDPRIDALRDLVRPHVFADANKEFTNTDFDGSIEHAVTVFSGGGQSTIDGLKSFITARRTHLLGSALDCSALGLEELASGTGLTAFPNPTTGPVIVALPAGMRPQDLVVTDALGRTVHVDATPQGIDLGGLPAGGYVLRLTVDGAEARAFVVKQ